MRTFRCDYCGEDDPCFLQTDGYAIIEPFACPFESDSSGENGYASADWVEIIEKEKQFAELKA